MSEKLWRVAVHEAGHAIVARALGEMVLCCLVGESIDGSVGGETNTFEKSPKYYCGGMAAELVLFDSVGAGFHKDLGDHLESFRLSVRSMDTKNLVIQWQSGFRLDLQKAKDILLREEDVLRELAEALLEAPREMKIGDGIEVEHRVLEGDALQTILNRVALTSVPGQTIPTIL